MKPNYAAEQAVPVSRLHELFFYNPTIGTLIHKTKKPNGVYALQPVGVVGTQGYGVVRVNGRQVKTHRIAYAMHHGRWPDGEIDHIDRDKLNNKIANLREVTRAENAKNVGTLSNNTSGIRGVHKAAGKWRVRIMVDKNRFHLGGFENLDDAAIVRRIAEHCLLGGIHEFPNYDNLPEEKAA